VNIFVLNLYLLQQKINRKLKKVNIAHPIYKHIGKPTRATTAPKPAKELTKPAQVTAFKGDFRFALAKKQNKLVLCGIVCVIKKPTNKDLNN